LQRTVFFISDGTGITAEAIGQSLLSQFENIPFNCVTIPYIDTIEKAQDTIKQINLAFDETNEKPLIFATLVNPKIREYLEQSHGLLMDVFNAFLNPLEKELQLKSSYTIGRSHAVSNYEHYQNRVSAVNFALACDDGIGTKYYDDAEVILIGISRSGKTPTSLYLALQFGILAANYPFTSDDMPNLHLPEILLPFKKKLFGLTINVERLHAIRAERRPNSTYSSYKQCEMEIKAVETLYRRNQIPFINTTTFSIEEIATRIMASLGIQRKTLG